MGRLKELYVQIEQMVNGGRGKAARELLINMGWTEWQADRAVSPMETAHAERRRLQAQRENARRVNRREPEQDELPGMRRRNHV